MSAGIHVARKDWVCDKCGKPIYKGQKHFSHLNSKYPIRRCKTCCLLEGFDSLEFALKENE